MIYFNNDYCEGCHPKILQRLQETNLVQTPGYGTDMFCAAAADRIRALCGNCDLDVHFLVGGTQANLTVIAAALRPFQAVICVDSGHINVHETGAIEATGHKVIGLPGMDGKVSAESIEAEVKAQRESQDAEHFAYPKMVYISHPTEYGTLYTLDELRLLRAVCDRYGMLLFLDGARLGFGLAAEGTDVTLPELAKLCDVFYIGGTKMGALFGEAVVIRNNALREDFRYMIKQRGGMLAKGRMLGIQFDALLENDLYFEIGKRANRLADQIRAALSAHGFREYIACNTNQVFAVLPNALLEDLSVHFCFSEICPVDEDHRCVRFCTSWATTEENVERLCSALSGFAK